MPRYTPHVVGWVVIMPMPPNGTTPTAGTPAAAPVRQGLHVPPPKFPRHLHFGCDGSGDVTHRGAVPERSRREEREEEKGSGSGPGRRAGQEEDRDEDEVVVIGT